MVYTAFHPGPAGPHWGSIAWGAFMLIAGTILILAMSRTLPKSEEEPKDGED